ncbi:MAG: CoA transferase [Acidimicrobiia bacterium]|nr:CoA transferase [Acidimicrobiia bacterium]MDH4364100.1 CoA transferase [Acidimicrobiia bacterium]MDH5289730.1 CoA transferase [Acidimicrobiia bacterium]
MSGGPLAGLRVIDFTADLGRFGAKLLAELGADVVRLREAGSRGGPMPGRAGAWGGVLDWWFDAAKLPVAAADLDLDTDDGRAAYRRLAAAADLVIESAPAGWLAERGVDHADLTPHNRRLTQVSVTPFGRTGPWAAWQGSDLVNGALGGVLSITGLPDVPLNSWGSQNWNFAGFAAAIAGLAGVMGARRTGRGQLVDLSAHEVVTGSIENLFMQYLYDDLLPLPKRAQRQGSLHWLGAYQVVPARTGNVMVTPTPVPQPLLDWMLARGVPEAAAFDGSNVEDVLARMPELMAAVRAFAATIDAGPLFTEAQARHIAFGEVQTVAQAAANPQFAFRQLYGDIDLGGGQRVRGPWRLVRFTETPIATPAPPPVQPLAPDLVAERWEAAPGSSAPVAEGEPADGAKPLAGLRVLDLSWVLAGPFATRILGDLGADVVKVQTEERATLVNRPDFPYYPVWNRSKRSVTLDLKAPGALDAIRPLVEQADILVENYSSGVLDRLGLGWEAVRAWNPGLVYISMSGCGHQGPWKDIISYAPTIHALCGLTHLTNPPDRGDVGCGFSLNDHAAGFAAALCVLAGVEARRRSGLGQYVDMAQLEVGAFLLGPALVDWFATGHEAQPAGNIDGLADAVPNEVHRCGDGRWLAVTAIDDAMWARLAGVLADNAADGRWATVDARRADRAAVDAAVAAWCARQADGRAAMATLQAAGVAAGVVQDAEDLVEHDEQHRARRFWLEADLPGFGPRRHDRFPALWDGDDLSPYRPAPAYLGEANFEVWTELAGLDPGQVADGVASGLFS